MSPHYKTAGTTHSHYGKWLRPLLTATLTTGGLGRVAHSGHSSGNRLRVIQ